MLDTIFGLPVHPLIVHATTVVVPAAAATVLLSALWPRFRRWSAWLPLALSLLAVVLTPLSTESGESLERRVEHSDLIETHSQLAEGLLPWVIGLALAAVLLSVVARRERREMPAVAPDPSTVDRSDEAPDRTSLVPRWLLVAGAVVGLVAALGTTVQVVRIGHSGAQAAWSDSVSQTPPPAGGDDGS
ncbi:DUF2231 domain-containing protein [Terracoccus sp. 273MFTsu3.1]|uniref:DUF2231 domain-containing protein n=1 Tax=Terracoccus sp. 273MFTsu3.1 TaxID=1172188 RepID=UPI0003660CFB|nr:DUF2231 domain-containing protein [Terracoccus sp. 273MFTsu3.1]